MAAFVSRVIGVFFEYDTPRIVHIRSKKVGVTNRFIQLCIIGYVIGYAIIFKKGYQEFDNVQGAITTKVKGVADYDGKIWDVADYIVPPQENNAFFVITNLIITPDQKNGTCEEDIRIPGANCTSSADVCKKGEPLLQGDGFMTGVCLNSSRDPGMKSCQVQAWCPTEDGSRSAPNPPALGIAENFTVFIKNNIEFPKFHVKRRNIPKSVRNETYLKSCRFDFHGNSLCPVFRLDTIVLNTGTSDFKSIATKVPILLKEFLQHLLYKNNKDRRNILGYEDDNELKNCRFTKDHPKYVFCPIFVLKDLAEYAGVQFSDIAKKGGVVQIIINWDCNLDYDVEDCIPEYSFRRLDSDQDILSKGYNFRYAKYYKDENGTETRTLYKAYGIKFILTLQGKAGKFSPVPLILNIGSGLAILSVATVLCDIMVLYVLKARKTYREKKYLEVVGDDAYQGMVNEDDGS